MEKRIPVETLIILQNHLDALPSRHARRRELVEETAHLYDVSVATVHRALRQHAQPRSIHRTDYNAPRVISQAEMKRYCELIAALKLRTENKNQKHHLSTRECIRLLVEHGVETAEGLVQVPAGLLKRSTVERYLKRWGYDRRTIHIEPVAVRFQAVNSNDCWQFDFSPSDLKRLKDEKALPGVPEPTLMLASVVDDRSGMCYQEYFSVQGEDTQTALRFLFNAMAPKTQPDCPLQGIPALLYLDNGPAAKSKLFQRVMAHLGIEVRTHMPKNSDGRRKTARAKGKVERPFLTVKSTLETLYHFHAPETLAEANEWLRQYLQRYNAMPHRSESHSRVEDWVKNLPPEGFRAMCSWERFCTFAREPEQRKAAIDACVNANGVRYQLAPEMAGEEVTLLWGLFDNELYVEFNGEKQGPFYPSEGPIPLNTFRKSKKTSAEKRADRVGELAKQISIPRAALAGEKESLRTLLEESQVVRLELPPSLPFQDANALEPTQFKNKIEAKTAIATFLCCPLARLLPAQMEEINRIVDASLDKKIVMAQVKAYFSLSLMERPGDDTCTGK